MCRPYLAAGSHHFVGFLILGVALIGCTACRSPVPRLVRLRVRLGVGLGSGSERTGSTAGISSINHVVIMVQENRSLDSYLGTLRQYWAQNNFPDQSFVGLPQFNPAAGAAPLMGAAPAIPGCDPSHPEDRATACSTTATW